MENKIFLENLPTIKYGERYNISWGDSIGEIVKAIYNGIDIEVEIINYDVKKQRLLIKYKEEEYSFSIYHFKQCNLTKLFKNRTKKFKIEIGQEFKDDKRDLIIIDREYKDYYNNKDKKMKFYKYICNTCGWTEGWISEYSLMKGCGCTCCCFNSKVVVDGINDIATTASWMIKFFKNQNDAKLYTKNSTKKIYLVCPNCGRESNIKTSIASLCNSENKKYLIGCGCSDGLSYGHKYLICLLNQLNISYKQNHTPKWSNFYNKTINKQHKGEYDFIIDDMNLIIEVDGSFHRKYNKMSGQTKEDSEYIDLNKDILAQKNGYKMIRIFYDDINGEIKKYILESSLIDTFNLSTIDWKKCDEFATKSIIKEVCEYWTKNNGLLKPKEISDRFKMSDVTIRKYLKLGNEIGWNIPIYNPQNGMELKIDNLTKIKYKKTKIYKNGILKGEFESVKELSIKSFELFGVKLNAGNISNVCRGNTKTYKGFTFEYVEEK